MQQNRNIAQFSLTFSSKTYRVFKSKKNNIYTDTQKKVNYKFSKQDFKKRVQFLLTLMFEVPIEIGIRICDAEEMRRQNQQYRNKNYPTDVLSFPAKNLQHTADVAYLGDILICFPVCLYQAKTARRTLAQELEKLLIHGIVHLKGFDHERNTSAWRVMSKLERAQQLELETVMGLPTWCKVELCTAC